MPSHPRSAWVRLGELLVRRRVELDPRYSNRRIFTDERIPGKYRIINALERGQRDTYEAGTVAAIEVAYRLAPGAIARFLAAGELEVQGAPRLSPAAGLSGEGTLEAAPAAAFADPDEDDTDPPMSPAMKTQAYAHLPDVEALVARATDLAAAEDPDHPVPRGAHLVEAGAEPHEGPRWDGLTDAGTRAVHRWSRRKIMIFMSIGRVRDAEHRAQQRGREAGLTAVRG